MQPSCVGRVVAWGLKHPQLPFSISHLCHHTPITTHKQLLLILMQEVMAEEPVAQLHITDGAHIREAEGELVHLCCLQQVRVVPLQTSD